MLSAPSIHALCLGAVALWLTMCSLGPLDQKWTWKDAAFIVGVMFTAFYGGKTVSNSKHLAQESHRDMRRNVPPIENLDLFHGDDMDISRNKVTCLFFFGTWCPHSRKALKMLHDFKEANVNGELQVLALTQETREELKVYAEKGSDASDYIPLDSLNFTIGIEDGSAAKDYLVRFKLLYNFPILFVIDKSQTIAWYGDPLASETQAAIQTALLEEDYIPLASDKHDASKLDYVKCPGG